MNDFSLLICNWYRQNKRSLPWRETNNPYFIWLSEIILQQTRVEQGLSYYAKFIKLFPTVSDLAKADEQVVLNAWQGLGYYSRARNLHHSAKIIQNEYEGIFPSTYSEILKLKGVGTYTAAAISSFAFDEPTAVVDGNVYRLLSRVFDINTPIDSSQGKKEFQLLADQLIDSKNPAIHNQAIMEIGAIVCTPSNPNCHTCPLNIKCLSLANKSINNRPVKANKTKVRNRYFHFLIYSNEQGDSIIEKRIHKDIWQNLYQFPLIETSIEPKVEEKKRWQDQHQESSEIVHILSHQKIFATFHHIHTLPSNIGENQIQIKLSNIQDYPLPRIIDRYLENMFHQS